MAAEGSEQRTKRSGFPAAFAVGLVLLLEISEFAWIALIFPMWVLLVSAYVLIASPPYEGGAGGVNRTPRHAG